MTDDEKQIKHLELIQQVVSRLAGNSFSIKGWSITLVSALFELAAKDSNVRYAILALLPALCFWGWMRTTFSRSGYSESSTMRYWETRQW